jgi:nucleotide-binding universal stress UspA family protein
MRNLMIAVDLSDATDQVIAVARKIAHVPGAKMHLVHVANPSLATVATEVGPIVSRGDLASLLQADRRKLHALADQLKSEGYQTSFFLFEGNPVDELVHQARRLQADVIVMGSHGHGALYHLLMGSTSEGVLRKACCPVLLVPCKKSQKTEETAAAGSNSTAEVSSIEDSAPTTG